jgi:hypothetical protein
MAVATGAVHKGGAWFKFGEHQWQGQPNVVKAIKEDADLEAMIEEELGLGAERRGS